MSQPTLVQHAIIEDSDRPLCKKETGSSHKLRKWSRGHQFVVRGGGHIDTWQPLYRYYIGVKVISVTMDDVVIPF